MSRNPIASVSSKRRACSGRLSPPLLFGCISLLGWLVLAIIAVPAVAADRWARLAVTVFTHIAQGNTLPNASFPEAMAQDGAGFLWIGTQNGLARWDGYRFRIYSPDRKLPGSLPDGEIVELHTDTRGRLWVATSSAGLVRYDPETDGFVRVALTMDDRVRPVIAAIADDGAGGILVGTSAGLKHLAADGQIVDTAVARDAGMDRHLRTDPIGAVLIDRSGALWIADEHGVARRRQGAPNFETIELPGFRPAASVSKLYEDGPRVWVGTVGSGAYVVEPGARRARAVREGRGADGRLATEPITDIVAARPGEIWLATSDDGILAVDSVTGTTRRIRHDPNLAGSLTVGSVMSLLRDRAGLIWVGTLDGISHTDPADQYLSTIVGPSGQPGGLAGRDVRSIAPAADGRVWAAAAMSGAVRLDPLGGRPSAVESPAPLTAGRADDIEVLAASPAGDMYLGGHQGLLHARPGSARLTRVALPAGARPTYIRALLYHAGALWYAGPDRVFRVEPNGRPVLAVGTGRAPRLTDNRITVLAPGPGSAIWIGTETGLNLFDPLTRRLERFPFDPDDPAQLSAGEISAVVSDGRGRVWIGTGGGGIDILRRDARRRPSFEHIGIAQGLPNGWIDAIVQDRQGRMWVSTDNGLAVIDEATLAVHPIREADGLGVTGYWINSGAANPNGEIYFGGIGGLTVVAPARYRAWSYAPPVAITDLTIGGRGVVASRYNGAAANAQPLVISPDANSVTVGFAALDYSAPEANRYAYRLDGFDTGWTEVPADRRFAAYTNLPPGDYQLRISGSNRSGRWVERKVPLAIRVRPAWYQTWPFAVAVVLAALGCVVLTVRARTDLLRRRQRELEREVAARTEQLHASQRELERLAYFDALTGLPNRRKFSETFARLLASGNDAVSFGVILLDLDGFKKINDSLGHDMGDAVLVETASRLKSAVRESDCLARLGGDEFAILLPDIDDGDDITRICDRIIGSFVASISVRDATIVASTSVGVALFPTDGQTQEALYKSADLALYDAKRSGRNAWRPYRAELRA